MWGSEIDLNYINGKTVIRETNPRRQWPSGKILH